MKTNHSIRVHDGLEAMSNCDDSCALARLSTNRALDEIVSFVI